MTRIRSAAPGLSLLPLLLVALFAARAVAADVEVMTSPTAADFIRALTPPGAATDTGVRGLRPAGTRSIGRGLTVNFKVQFEFGSDRLTADAKLVLSELATAITSNELSDYKFLIAGHTDAVGSAEFNLLLSERRAKAVRDFLVSTVDVSPDRLQDVGWGESRLLDGDNPDGDVNRRVEITNIGGR